MVGYVWGESKDYRALELHRVTSEELNEIRRLEEAGVLVATGHPDPETIRRMNDVYGKDVEASIAKARKAVERDGYGLQKNVESRSRSSMRGTSKTAVRCN